MSHADKSAPLNSHDEKSFQQKQDSERSVSRNEVLRTSERPQNVRGSDR